MGLMEDILDSKGVVYEELEDDEKQTLERWMGNLEQNQLTVESIREHISAMKASVEDAMSEEQDNYDWLTLVTLFIPIFGVIKKWYADRKRLRLEARLKNYMLLEAFLMGPEKARKAIEKALATVARKN